jgi:O-antigen/teichoic acid export membrane protein
MSRLRRAARATVVVQFFSLAGAALSLITVPLYLQWLGAERYGLMLTAFACAGYLMFSDAGLSWASMLLIAQAHGREDRAEIARIVRNSFTLASLSALLVAVLSTCGYFLLRLQWTPLVDFVHRIPEASGLAVAIGVQVIVSLASSPIYNVLIGLQESHLAAMYQGLARISGTAASLWAASWGASLGIIVISASICALAAALACAIHILRRHRWAFRRGSFWEPHQIRAQYRAGAKSFALQIGRVFVGSAPVFSISSQAGAQFVPGFTVPLTLLNTPLAVIMSFNATLQAGYGEAIGKQDYSWIRSTVRSILRNMLLLQALLATGFLMLAPTVTALWTHNKIQLSPPLIISVLLVGLTSSTLTVFQFALSGTNRHREAGLSELANGALCLLFGILVVRFWGFAWVGVGVFSAAVVTSLWILPRQLRKHFELRNLWPEKTFFAGVIVAGGLASLLGLGIDRLGMWVSPSHPWLLVAIVAFAISVTYITTLRIMLPEDYKRLTSQFARIGGNMG